MCTNFIYIDEAVPKIFHLDYFAEIDIYEKPEISIREKETQLGATIFL